MAHHVSLIGIQAGAARRTLELSPARTEEALRTIEEGARTAVAELHHTLVALHEEDAGVSPAAAAVSVLGVRQLSELVAESDRGGTPTALRVLGAPVPLPPGVDLTLHRVAQEALTNVRKHAGTGARAQVRLSYQRDAVELEVADTGRGFGETAGSGLGQVGMRERVTSVGGTLTVGPTEHGYRLVACIPLLDQERAGTYPDRSAPFGTDGAVTDHLEPTAP